MRIEVPTRMRETFREKLNKKDREDVLKLLARVSEASYRRGAQQGISFADKLELKSILLRGSKLAQWRYKQSLDKSKGVDGLNFELLNSSKRRFQAEYNNLIGDLWLGS